MSAEGIKLFRHTMDRLYLDPSVPAWKSTLEHTKTHLTKQKIALKFLKICDTDEIPYPTTLTQVKPFWDFILNRHLTDPSQINDRMRAVARVIMTAILGKVTSQPDPDNVEGTSLKSLIEAVGVPQSTNFICSIKLEKTKQLVQDLDSECPGLIDRLLIESKS